jgi:polysaccharide export outer membrane protein
VLIAGSVFGQVQPEPYKLGPEDVVTVAVRNHLEFSGDFLVPSDGIVDLPVAGPTKTAGLTLTEVRTILLKALAKRIIDPEVNVILKIARVRRVYVEGAALKVSLPVDYKPGFRITECIAAVGGFAPDVQVIDCHVTVLRVGSNKVEDYALSDVMAGIPSANVPVFPGDVVTVRSLESIPVYVVGQVKLPGILKMRIDQVSLMSSIAMAGGLLPTASTANVTITHGDGQVEKVDISGVVLNGDKVQLPTLHSGDLVSVPELQSRFGIAGLVKQPGLFPLPDGKSYKLSDAIALAGGWDTKRARMSKIAVLRNDHGKMQRMVINYGFFLSKGDASQNITLQPGDVIYVPETNSIDWTAVFQAVTATYFIANTSKL